MPQPIALAEMSAVGFEVAGLAPAIGRAIRAEDERPGAAPVVVIGDAEWRRRFGANPGVVGMTIQLGAAHHTVVGVMPEGFAFPLSHSYWIPLRLDAFTRRGGGERFTVFGKRADGAALQGGRVSGASSWQST